MLAPAPSAVVVRERRRGQRRAPERPQQLGGQRDPPDIFSKSEGLGQPAGED